MEKHSIALKKYDKVLIIPDVHGRSFWKDAVKGREDWRIIFLGDYLDRYAFENITTEETLQNFKEIIEFKKSHKENVTLLLGNHDCTYAFPNGINICYCRTDIHHYQEIKNLFTENYELFSIVTSLNIDGKEFVFSHAPILKNWYKLHFKKINVIKQLSEDFQSMTSNFLSALTDVDYYRGGNYDCGSIVWADVRSLAVDGQPLAIEGAFSIFGHTLSFDGPIVADNYACLDCRKAFILNENGLITDIDGKEVEKTVLK